MWPSFNTSDFAMEFYGLWKVKFKIIVTKLLEKKLKDFSEKIVAQQYLDFIKCN